MVNTMTQSPLEKLPGEHKLLPGFTDGVARQNGVFTIGNSGEPNDTSAVHYPVFPFDQGSLAGHVPHVTHAISTSQQAHTIDAKNASAHGSVLPRPKRVSAARASTLWRGTPPAELEGDITRPRKIARNAPKHGLVAAAKRFESADANGFAARPAQNAKKAVLLAERRPPSRRHRKPRHLGDDMLTDTDDMMQSLDGAPMAYEAAGSYRFEELVTEANAASETEHIPDLGKHHNGDVLVCQADDTTRVGAGGNNSNGAALNPIAAETATLATKTEPPPLPILAPATIYDADDKHVHAVHDNSTPKASAVPQQPSPQPPASATKWQSTLRQRAKHVYYGPSPSPQLAVENAEDDVGLSTKCAKRKCAPPSSAVHSKQGDMVRLGNGEDQDEGGGDDAAQPREAMLGCGRCRYSIAGCKICRAGAKFARRFARWQPDGGHPQCDIPAAKTFRPTPEEFADPMAYVTKIMPEAAQYGLAHIVPPADWNPPFALEKGTNGMSMESFRFLIRKQVTSSLCVRAAPTKQATGDDAEGGNWTGFSGAGKNFNGVVPDGRYAGRMKTETASAFAAATMGVEVDGRQTPMEQAPNPWINCCDDVQGVQVPAAAQILPGRLAAGGDSSDSGVLPSTCAVKELQTDSCLNSESGCEDDGDVVDEDQAENGQFGFVTLDKKHTLRSFAAYADWAKSLHFSHPAPSGQGLPSTPSKRNPRLFPTQRCPPVEPSVEEIEAEFWRIVDNGHSEQHVVEALYGQDIDSGHHGSGFPLPKWRRELLEAHLTAERQAANVQRGRRSSHKKTKEVRLPPPSPGREEEYAHHAWNINNMPRCKSSVLRYLLGDGLITGVMVPWLYVGSCLSAFCWHVEDHALYSVNYLHLGSPKVWYSVPAAATTSLEEAMRDALPHLFEASPQLLYQLVTMVSPSELRKRNVPVYRVVHEAGSFVITMPNAYHAGFNTGFNVAEAVNFAAPNWIPFGTDVAKKYRDARKPVTMSHDALLVALVSAAHHVPPTKHTRLNANGYVRSSKREGETRDGAVAGILKDVAGAVAAGKADAFRNEAVLECDDDVTNGHDENKIPCPESVLLGNIPWEDVPLEGIVLATGELALRATEERQIWCKGFAALCVPDLPRRRMDVTAQPGAKDACGVHLNTSECDCEECQGDLWLAAVVSSEAPGTAMCMEHAHKLVEKHKCEVASLVLLYRYAPDELQAMVDVSVERMQGAAEAVKAALERRERWLAEAPKLLPLGPLYPTRQGRPVKPDGNECTEADKAGKMVAEDSSGGGTNHAGNAAQKGGIPMPSNGVVSVATTYI